MLTASVLGSAPEMSERIFFGGIHNTSVTSLFLPSPSFGYEHERPDARGKKREYDVKVELLCDTSHLARGSLEAFARLSGISSTAKL